MSVIIMNKVIILTALLLGTAAIASATQVKRSSNGLIAGDCSTWNCQTLFKDLNRRYPQYIQQYQKECAAPSRMAIRVLAADVTNQGIPIAALDCWEAQKDKDGHRAGYILGTLPVPGQEAKFLAPLPDSPHTKELQKRYPKEIQAAQFRCASRGGGLDLIENKTDRTVQLQCFFQGGATMIDENDDFKWDSDTRGASVDEILGTFAVGRTSRESNNICQLTASNQRSWSSCIDKLVRVKGKMPKMAMSHVQRNVGIPGEKQIFQSYMDALNYQFVLLSEQPITCKHEFEVVGTLKRFTLGESSGSKNSYTNYDIHVQQVTCLER
jgi:hypothetical protein